MHRHFNVSVVCTMSVQPSALSIILHPLCSLADTVLHNIYIYICKIAYDVVRIKSRVLRYYHDPVYI